MNNILSDHFDMTGTSQHFLCIKPKEIYLQGHYKV